MHLVLTSLTQRDDLPQQHAKRPDVTRRAVDALVQRLGRHPAQRQTSLRLALVLTHQRDVTRRTEVANLADELLVDEHVPGGQVTVQQLKCARAQHTNTRSQSCDYHPLALKRNKFSDCKVNTCTYMRSWATAGVGEGKFVCGIFLRTAKIAHLL